jgi:DnaJ-class molecular chaperone
MNLKEAYSILDVNENTSEDELKKKYRTLAAKYHPDVYKNDNGDKFKQINEAYNFIKDPPKEQFRGNPFGVNIEDLFNSQFGGFNINVNGMPFGFNISPDINLSLELTYEEFVLGATKKIQFKRLDKNKKEETLTIDLKIPAFASKLRIRDKGHYTGNRAKPHTDVFVNMLVNDNRFKINGNALILEKNIPMRDAIYGASIDVDLVFLKLQIQIQEYTKNRDTISFNLDNSYFRVVNIIWIVDYPSNIKELIK